MIPRFTTACLLTAGITLLPGGTSALAGGGYVSGSITLTLAGPGTLVANSINGSITFDAPVVDHPLDVNGTHVTLRATPQGNGATFSGWAGACAASGTNETCTVQLVPAGSTECRWAAAVFERLPNERTPAPVDPCAPKGGGAGGGGAGGGSGASPGGSSTGTGPLPAAGTTLAGGATVVRRAPALPRSRMTVQGGRVRGTGRAPVGATRMVQSLVLVGARGITAAGRCRLTGPARSFTCTASAPPGRWRVITQARRGATVIAQSIVTVRIR